MGMGIATLALLDDLFQRGALPRQGSVMELGAQELFLKGYETALEAFGARFDVSLAGLAAHAPRPALAQALFEGINWTYASIDLDHDHGATRFDLNVDAAPPGQAYDLVTNLGTSEHVFNQLNCFVVAHDFTCRGGVMLHAVPCLGYPDHGFFNYHPNLFRSLASANQYEILGLYYNPAISSSVLIPWASDLLSYLSLTPRTSGGIFVVMRKTTDERFVVPQQGRYAHIPLRMPVDGRLLNGGADAHEEKLTEEKAKRKAERRALRNAERDQQKAPGMLPTRLLAAQRWVRGLVRKLGDAVKGVWR